MKKLLAVLTASVMIIVACTTTQQKTALNTIGSIEATVTASVDSYYTLVIKGSLPTNGVPKISKAYNDLQASVKLALDGVQFNTNALAPGNLITESQDLINLINTVKGQKP